MKTSLISDLMSALGIFILVIVGSTSAVLFLLKVVNAYFDRREQKRRGFLKDYAFPASCYLEVQHRYPHLSSQQIALAFEQLRLYFEVCLVYSTPSSTKLVAMPSMLVDTCWHTHICETREYQSFCKSVFGGFLHHQSKVNTSFPLLDISADDVNNGDEAKLSAEAKTQRELDYKNQLSAARIFHWAQSLDGSLYSSNEMQVPILYSIDQEFIIEDGYFYSAEVLNFLAQFDLKAAEAVVTRRETEAAGGNAAACGDGGSCGGCGGSI